MKNLSKFSLPKLPPLLFYWGLFFFNFEIISAFNAYYYGIYTVKANAIPSVLRFTAINIFVSFFLGLIFYVLDTIALWLPGKKVRSHLLPAIAGILALLFCFDITYVSFFHYPLHLSELDYLNSTSFFLGAVSFIFQKTFLYPAAIQVVVFLFLYFVFVKKERVNQKISFSFVFFTALGLAACLITANWFVHHTVIEKRATHNFLQDMIRETRFNKIQKTNYSIDLKQDYDALKSIENFNQKKHQKYSEKKLLKLIQRASTQSSSKLQEHIKQKVQDIINSKEPLYVWVVLLESFKPQNGKNLFPKNPVTYEPFVDQLASNSLSYRNAWTSSNVTRCGHGAVLCGVYSGHQSDLFHHSDANPKPCLGQALKNHFKDKVHTTFWQAGLPNLDNAFFFWSNHGMDHVVVPDDLPQKSAYTYWGKSDLSLVKYTLAQLQQKTPKKLIQFHVFVSITNHAPFNMPHDMQPMPPDLVKQAPDKDSFGAYYTDTAVKKLVNGLKKIPLSPKNHQSIWDHSLFFLVNDHGVNTNDLRYPKGTLKNDWDIVNAQSRANLIVSGGIVQSELNLLSQNEKNKIQKKLHSQVDIYHTILEVLNIPDRASSGVSLFTTKDRKIPVIVENEKIFLPSVEKVGRGIWFDRNRVLSEPLSRLEKKLPSDQRTRQFAKIGLAYYQASEYYKTHKPKNDESG